MSDSNAFASLSPTLLARKGGAKPAMRRQMGSSLAAFDGQAARDNDELEDLGWNDMGHDEDQRSADVLPLTPEPPNPEAEADTRRQDQAAAKALVPDVVKQQESIAQRVAEKPVPAKEEAPKAAAPKRARRSALARGKRAAFTLRLDADRHLKLKLASTIKNRSAQQLVTQALDEMLENMPDLGTLAAQMKRS